MDTNLLERPKPATSAKARRSSSRSASRRSTDRSTGRDSKREKRSFGSIRRLPSGRRQARYTGPNGERVVAPVTFSDKIDAEDWLAAERRRIETSPETWTPPKTYVEQVRRQAEAMPTFESYASHYLDTRKVKGRFLERSTKRTYASHLARHIVPVLGAFRIDQITVSMCVEWYDNLAPEHPKTRRECYALARAIMAEATGPNGPLPGRLNPIFVRGGATMTSPKRDTLVTSDELAALLVVIRDQWKAMLLIAAWCGLRFGEITELKRSDIDLTKKIIRVRRAVSRGEDGSRYVKAPKSDAGVRNQRIPSHIVGALGDHLRNHVDPEPDALVFPGPRGGWLQEATFAGSATGWHAARRAIGRDDLRFHDLRAVGATLLAQQGASIAEIQTFLGDSTPAAAMRYVRAAQSRMDVLTERLAVVAAGSW